MSNMICSYFFYIKLGSIFNSISFDLVKNDRFIFVLNQIATLDLKCIFKLQLLVNFDL